MDSYTVELSTADLKNNKIRLAGCRAGFFPGDAYGDPSEKTGQTGRRITLYLQGLPEPVKTDIPVDKKIFRCRSRIRGFFEEHDFKPRDKVRIEKIARRTYRVRPQNAQLTFIDLFAGIGGMRIAFEKAGCKCVFTSEWDKFAQQTYEANFGEKPQGDIRKIPSSQIPEHDILLAGFPCQPFSISGVSKKYARVRPHGVDDPTQGTLFFEIIRVLKARKPMAFLLENVKNLRSHDKGNTYKVILSSLHKLGYTFYAQVIDADTYVPQHRERIFIVGFREPLFFSFPQHAPEKKPKFKDILQKHVDPKYTLTDHLWNYLQDYAKKHKAKGNGFGFGLTDLNGRSRTLSARYYKDGAEVLIPQGQARNPRRLTPRECANLMGFTHMKPNFTIPVSDTQAYKQFGNAVVVPVVYDIAKAMTKTLQER